MSRYIIRDIKFIEIFENDNAGHFNETADMVVINFKNGEVINLRACDIELCGSIIVSKRQQDFIGSAEPDCLHLSIKILESVLFPIQCRKCKQILNINIED